MLIVTAGKSHGAGDSEVVVGPCARCYLGPNINKPVYVARRVLKKNSVNIVRRLVFLHRTNDDTKTSSLDVFRSISSASLTALASRSTKILRTMSNLSPPNGTRHI